MQQVTKPFVHPIRKYMKELQELKEEALAGGEENMKDEKQQQCQAAMQQFQFTHFVPQDKNGNVTGLKAVKLTSNQPVTTLPAGSAILKQPGKSQIYWSNARVMDVCVWGGGGGPHRIHFQWLKLPGIALVVSTELLAIHDQLMCFWS